MAHKRRTAAEINEILAKEFVPAEQKKAALQNALFETTKNNPFMGSALQSMNILYTHMIPTAGVSFNNDLKRWDLFINPKFFCKQLSPEQRKGVLLHELLHITHRHPMRVPFAKLPPRKTQLMNIAMDMAINQYIKATDLPHGCTICKNKKGQTKEHDENCPGYGIYVEDFEDVDETTGKKTPWPTNKTSEFYYEKLLQRFDDPDKQDGDGEGEGEGGEGDGEGNGGSDPSQGNGQGKGKGKKVQGKASGNAKDPNGNAGGGASTKDLPETMDSHDWDGSPSEKDMLDATEDLIKRAMIKCNYDHSKLPGHVQDLLQQIDTRRKELDYRSIILMAMKASLPANVRVNTWTKPSKRYGNLAQGRKNGENPKLEIFIDTSGSISVEEANDFLDIVDEFLKVGAKECNLNFFNTSNYFNEKYKKGRKIKRDEIKSGGTDLRESLSLVAQKRPDLAIFITDGYYDDVDVESMVGNSQKFPRTVFIISSGGTMKHPFADREWARSVQIPDQHGRRRD